MEFIILGSLSFYINFEKKVAWKMFQHFQRGCRESIKKQKHRAKYTDKRELLCEKVKNQQKLVFESVTQNTLIFRKIVIVTYDKMFFPSKI